MFDRFGCHKYETTLNRNLIVSIEETQMSGWTPVLTQARNRLETPGVIKALDRCTRKAFQPGLRPSLLRPSGSHAPGVAPAQGRAEGAAGQAWRLRTGQWAGLAACVDVPVPEIRASGFCPSSLLASGTDP